MSRDRSRSPGLAKRFRSRDRASYRDAPYKRDKPAYRQDYLCNKCKRPGHFARDCPNATVCNNCGLPGHLASECTSTTMCWNCKESGHLSSECPNDPVCHMCGKIGHLARDCHNLNSSTYDARLCNNCYKPGHLAAECTNEKACNNCRKTGHVARECSNDPVCNICSISGHVARQCPKSGMSGSTKSRPSSFLGSFGSSRDDPFRDMICRNCVKTGPSITDAAVGRIAQGTKALTEGGYEKIFASTFETVPDEKLLKYYPCYLSTSAGPVMGILYMSTAKLAFSSDNPLSYKVGDETQWSYYKVVIPLHQLKAVNPSKSKANPAEKYIQIISVDNHEFWFMGFVNYDSAVQYLQGALQSHHPV